MSESVLRRKVVRPRPPPVEAAGPAGSPLAQALPRALMRAVNAGAGLVARSGAVVERGLDLAEGLDRLDVDGFMALLAPVERPGDRAGLLVLDPGLFAALIEALTIGRLSSDGPGPVRRATATDAALLAAVVDRLLSELERGLAEAGGQAATGAWQMARSLSDPRLLGAILDEGRYHMIELPLTLSLSAGGSAAPERPGRIALLLPGDAADPAPPQAPGAVLGRRGEPETGDPGSQPCPAEPALLGAPVVLEAVLGRIVLPLSEVMGLQPGQRLELPLAALDAVGLVGPDGRTHAVARLGQSRGMRAVRLGDLPGAEDAGAPPTPAPPFGRLEAGAARLVGG